jgi:PEP-CTERM motif
MKKLMFAALALSAAFATPASAVTIVGTTVGAPTYNRLVSLGTLSGVGTAVAYKTTAFTVSTSGSYTFLMTTVGLYDPFLSLYGTAFNPATPIANALAVNDDFTAGNFNQSGFTFALLAGTSYFAVASGFDNFDFGDYTLAINGPGTVIIGGAIPEASTWAMIIAGFGIVGAALRRRRRSIVALA